MVKDINSNWFAVAEHDLKIAKLCIKGNEPLGVMFHLHACLEKILKGIAEELGQESPKIHNLKRLAVQICKINLEKKQEELLEVLDQSYIDSRYPEDIAFFNEKYNREFCKLILKEVEKAIKWLKSLLENS